MITTTRNSIINLNLSLFTHIIHFHPISPIRIKNRSSILLRIDLTPQSFTIINVSHVSVLDDLQLRSDPSWVCSQLRANLNITQPYIPDFQRTFLNKFFRLFSWFLFFLRLLEGDLFYLLFFPTITFFMGFLSLETLTDTNLVIE